MRTAKFTLLAGTVFCAIGLPQVATAQIANEVSSADPESANTIIVTARRQAEALEDVPASISVLTAADIANSGVEVAADFAQLVPGVTIVTGNSEAGDTQISIRGLNGARDAENNVALVVDGILKSNTAALNQRQGTLQQIEVLKGPQGALYGRNAAAGAVVITTKKPGQTFEGDFSASYGSDKTFNASAVLSGPLSENLALLVGGDYGKSDGFFRNSFLPSAQNAQLYPGNSRKAASVDYYESYNVDGRLLWTPADGTELDGKVHYGHHKGGSIVFNAAFQIPFLEQLTGSELFNLDANKQNFIFTPNVRPSNKMKTVESSLRLKSDLGWAELNAYVAYNDIRNYLVADGTSGSFGFFKNEQNCISTGQALTGFPVQAPFAVDPANPGASLPPYSPTTCDGTQYQQRDQKDFSSEIRLVGSEGALNWQVGAYFLHIKRRVCFNLGLDTGQGPVLECFTTDARNPTESLADDTFKTDVFAGFGSLDYKFSDALSVGLALRYDIEKRHVSNNIPLDARSRWVGNVLTGHPNGTQTTSANYYMNAALDPAYNPSGILAPRSKTFKQLQPKITIAYKPDPDVTLFANWGIGFKSGGFNSGGSETIVNQFFNAQFDAGISIFDTYRKEKSSAFEAGVKWVGADWVSLDMAAYHTVVDDMQFFEFFVGPFGLLRVVSNIDRATINGIEASANFKPTKGLMLYASGNYNDTKIKKNSARPYTEGNRIPYSSEYTVNLGGQYEAAAFGDTDLLLRADYRINGPTWFHTVQNNNVPNIFGLEGNFTNAQREAYGVLNLRGGIKSERWSVMAFADNVFGKKFLKEVIPAPEFGGVFVAPGARSYYGVQVGYNF